MSQPSFAAYEQLLEAGQRAISTKPTLEAVGSLNRWSRKALAYRAGTAVPLGVTLEEWMERAGVPRDEVSARSFEERHIGSSVEVLDKAVAELMKTQITEFVFGDYLRASRKNSVVIVGNLLTRLATDEQDAGSIMQIDFMRADDPLPLFTGVQVQRDPRNERSEAGVIFVLDGISVVHGMVTEVNSTLQYAVNEGEGALPVSDEVRLHRLTDFAISMAQ